MPLGTVAESLALTSTAVFFGAALYISLVEHPARLEAGVDVALRQFPHSYRRAARLQASLAMIGSLAGVAAWLLGASAWWAVSALLLFAVVPLTLVVIFPTNKRLHDPSLRPADPAALGLLRRWGTLHWLRTGLSFLAFGVQVFMRFLAAFVLLGTLGSGPAAAADCQSPANLLAQHNSGFDKDAQGWTAVPGASMSHDVADRGVLKAGADSQGSLTIMGPCVAAQGKTGYHISARLRVAAGTVYFCSVNVFQYSDDHCSQGEEPLGSAPGPPATAWATVKGSATTGAARSVQVRPVCSGQPGFAVQFDDFVFGKG